MNSVCVHACVHVGGGGGTCMHKSWVRAFFLGKSYMSLSAILKY
jgi:hypothetical protein